jgi:NAD(P)-dependent dehydrogenase (short-subunit alcohol dehydrogenase family)
VITMGWTPTEGEISLRQSQGIDEIELHRIASSILPAGRMVEIDEITPTVIHLLSDESAMLSGSNIRITGGWFI